MFRSIKKTACGLFLITLFGFSAGEFYDSIRINEDQFGIFFYCVWMNHKELQIRDEKDSGRLPNSGVVRMMNHEKKSLNV